MANEKRIHFPRLTTGTFLFPDICLLIWSHQLYWVSEVSHMEYSGLLQKVVRNIYMENFHYVLTYFTTALLAHCAALKISR